MSCLLEEVDLPVSITWLKDGHPLSSAHHGHATPTLAGLGLEVRMLDKYSSRLVIPRLQAAHAGNYTCQATNAARTATYTAALAVSGNVAPSRPARPAQHGAVVVEAPPHCTVHSSCLSTAPAATPHRTAPPQSRSHSPPLTPPASKDTHHSPSIPPYITHHSFPPPSVAADGVRRWLWLFDAVQHTDRRCGSVLSLTAYRAPRPPTGDTGLAFTTSTLTTNPCVHPPPHHSTQ